MTSTERITDAFPPYDGGRADIAPPAWDRVRLDRCGWRWREDASGAWAFVSWYPGG